VEYRHDARGQPALAGSRASGSDASLFAALRYSLVCEESGEALEWRTLAVRLLYDYVKLLHGPSGHGFSHAVEFLHLAGQLAIPSPSPFIQSLSSVILSIDSLLAAHHWQKLDASPEESEC